jgi:ribosomal protein L7/L12
MTMKEMCVLLSVLTGSMRKQKREATRAVLAAGVREAQAMEVERELLQRRRDQLIDDIQVLQDQLVEKEAKCSELRRVVAELRTAQVYREKLGPSTEHGGPRNLYANTSWVRTHKIEAIRLVREATLLGLREAKDRFDGITDLAGTTVLLVAGVNPAYRLEDKDVYIRNYEMGNVWLS